MKSIFLIMTLFLSFNSFTEVKKSRQERLEMLVNLEQGYFNSIKRDAYIKARWKCGLDATIDYFHLGIALLGESMPVSGYATHLGDKLTELFGWETLKRQKRLVGEYSMNYDKYFASLGGGILNGLTLLGPEMKILIDPSIPRQRVAAHKKFVEEYMRTTFSKTIIAREAVLIDSRECWEAKMDIFLLADASEIREDLNKINPEIANGEEGKQFPFIDFIKNPPQDEVVPQ